MPKIQGTKTPGRSRPHKQQGTKTPGRSRPHKQCLKYKVQKLQVGHVLTNNA